MNRQLAESIAMFMRDMPELVLRDFLSALGTNDNRDLAIEHLPTHSLRRSMQTIFAMADQSGLGDDHVALALESAFLAGHQWKQSSNWELVWTGPSPPNSKLRRTDQALLELIRNSQHELWVVSFAAYKVKVVTDALRDAIARNVQVNLVLESSEESEGRLTFDQLAALQQILGHKAKVFIWPTENRQPSADGIRGMLHAKCACCDDRWLFISSANLTEAAMHLNIEMGVLAKSPNHASSVQQRLRWMVEHQILKLINPLKS
jgi:phosphatidylserine/phosphatidylglycerophosphate/cardiolipin synthase-like enzyme